MRARWYDASTGQFLSVDPLTAATGQDYSYARDDPVTSVDPLGTIATSPWCAPNGVSAELTNATGASLPAFDDPNFYTAFGHYFEQLWFSINWQPTEAGLDRQAQLLNFFYEVMYEYWTDNSQNDPHSLESYYGSSWQSAYGGATAAVGRTALGIGPDLLSAITYGDIAADLVKWLLHNGLQLLNGVHPPTLPASGTSDQSQ